MRLVLISPEDNRPAEIPVLGDLFAAGLERYHVRKPHASAEDLRSWLRHIPTQWRRRLILHQHHELADEFGLGGRHWKDGVERNFAGRPAPQREAQVWNDAGHLFTSRSCHDLATLRASLGQFDSVFFGPVYPSLSKPGYGPGENRIGEAIGAILSTRSLPEHRTAVIAIGGITAEKVAPLAALGFDGVAVLGAVWQATDPIRIFGALQAACLSRRSQANPNVRTGLADYDGARASTNRNSSLGTSGSTLTA